LEVPRPDFIGGEVRCSHSLFSAASPDRWTRRASFTGLAAVSSRSVADCFKYPLRNGSINEA
jgi:hypothetical protein